jgi:metal-responsive CopG/Arc/MetJ family transcriptional regulator
MGTLSVSVPDELKERMDKLDEINWSAVARKAFEQKIEQIEFLQKISKKSKLTEKDAEKISVKINENMAKKFRRM